ncbi:MAG: hypothetical protein LBT15_06070 [Synergistaceae bacterium]|jgi:hypothetical protein|nr:hypothetical protein [Synergistaceae bacterium]
MTTKKAPWGDLLMLQMVYLFSLVLRHLPEKFMEEVFYFMGMTDLDDGDNEQRRAYHLQRSLP